MKSKLKKVAALAALFFGIAAAFTFSDILITDKNGAYANDGRTVLSSEEQLFPQANINEFATYAANQDKMLYSRIGLEKDGVNALDVTRGRTEKHRSVIVVIDSGVKYDHTEFLDENGETRISERSYSVGTKTTVKQSGWSIIDDVEVKNADGTLVSSYHGTQVCGSIFASHTNGTGFYGLADEAELVFVKIPFRYSDGRYSYSTDDVQAALDYAISIKPDVVNLSMGNYIATNYFGSRISRLKNNGTVVVTAAGNSSRSDTHYPSADSNAVGVGAFDNLRYLSADTTSYPLASYSSFGDKNVNICAPGRFYQTYTDKDGASIYTESNGTSVSAPVVTAAVALYRSLYPEATPDEIIEKLYTSATDQGDLGKDYYFGYGGLNISEFLFGKSGQVTFDYNNGSSATMPITEGVALKEYPFPAENFYGKSFGGWYLDRACTQPLNYYSQVLPSGATVYAKWTERDTQGAFDYTLQKDGNGVIKGYYGNSDRIFVPDEIAVNGANYAVKTIAARAFESCGAKKIIVPEGVTRLDEYSFARNTFEFVYLPASINYVRLYAFENSRGNLYLQGADLTGDKTKYLVSTTPAARWDNNSSLTVTADAGEYTYKNGVEIIGKTLLCYDGTGEELILGAPVRLIAEKAAYENQHLKKAVLLSVEEIGASAFEGCDNLISLQIPSVREIKENAFYGCGGLTDIEFPASLTEIGANAFLNCISLTELNFSECQSLLTIGSAAFKGCSQIKILDLQGATSLVSLSAQAFQGCKNLFIASLPENLVSVGSSVFAQCVNLTALKIPFTGLNTTNNQYSHFGIIFGASSPQTQASSIPATLKSVYITGNNKINSSALNGLSGIKVFAGGSFEGNTDCTVFTQGNFSLIEIYSQGKLCGLYGGSLSSAIEESVLNSAFTSPHGLAAQGFDIDGDGQADAVPANLPETTGVTAWSLTAEKVPAVTVKFFNFDGALLSENQYEYGEEIVLPSVPAKPSTEKYLYEFTGWDKQLTKAVADAEYTAVFKDIKRYYEIKFLDSDQRVLGVLSLEYGKVPAAPKVADRAIDETYYDKFIGWDKAVSAVTEQTVYTAQYSKEYVEYIITFVYADNNAKFAEQKYHYGDTVTPPDTKRANDNIFSYEFSKWSSGFETVTGNAQYSAEYDRTFIEYEIVFKNYDGTAISAASYHYGDIPKVPENPVRASDDEFDYTFIGWDKTVTAVKGNAEYIAQYSSKSNSSFTIRFIADNIVISSTDYKRGEKITVPADPEKTVSATTYYYIFEGWTPQISETAEKDEDYTAVFVRMVRIKFLDWDKSVISEKEYRQNSEITVPQNPSRQADGKDICKYIFEGWDKTVSLKASASAEYTAVYKAVEHNYIESERKAATCTEKGYIKYSCTECGESYSTEIAATGHTPSDWIIDKQPTAQEDGHKYKECTKCHTKLEEETIPKLADEKPPEDDKNKGGDNSVLIYASIGAAAGCLIIAGVVIVIIKKRRR